MFVRVHVRVCVLACVCMGVVVHVSARLHIPWIRGPAIWKRPSMSVFVFFCRHGLWSQGAPAFNAHILHDLDPPAALPAGGINQALCRRAETQTARVILTLDTFLPSLQATAVILIPNHHLHHNPRGEGNTQEVDVVLFGQRCSSGSPICWGEAARLWLIT